METCLQGVPTPAGTRMSISENGVEIAHAYLYLLVNDAHAAPFGAIEDVFVIPEHRGKGHGRRLISQLVCLARTAGCYKIVLSSRDGRDRLHGWYEKLGFTKHGVSFRMDL